MQTLTENLVEINSLAEQNYNNWQDINQGLEDLKKIYEEKKEITPAKKKFSFIAWIKKLFDRPIDFSMKNAPRGKSEKSDWQKYCEKQDAIRNSWKY